jgi:hypothetical protein
MAPELDGRYARALGFISDDRTRKRPTATVLADLLPPDAPAAWRLRACLVGGGALVRYGLVGGDEAPPPGTPWSDIGRAPAAEVVARFLAEEDEIPRYAPYLKLTTRGARSTEAGTRHSPAWLLDRLGGLPHRPDSSGPAPVVDLPGDDETLTWFEATAQASGRSVVVLDLNHVEPAGWSEFHAAAMAGARVAMLHRAILLVTGLGQLAADGGERMHSSARLVRHLRPLVPVLAVHGGGGWLEAATDGGGGTWRLERPGMGYAARRAAWEEAARAVRLTLAPADVRTLASTLRFGSARIRATMALCRGASPADAEAVSGDAVRAHAREVSRFDAPALVRRLGVEFGWDDLILPAPILAQLREIPSHVRHAGQVIEDWGYAARFPYGQGVTALFSGPSGTGKTMAAQIIARDLGVEVFQLDLAKTVSKYIGETEKNLDRIFDAAEGASALLLVDEADALFGKRTEVKDAHDRYANVEVAYLLQRMEAYRGLAILTTNVKQNIDGSFLRRLRFVVEFPPPGFKERLAIWRRAFPSGAPRDPALDLTSLAQRLPLTGGHIQQIALLAGFAAAEECAATGGDGQIGVRHVVRATRQQLLKLGMTSAEQAIAEMAA